MTVLLVVGGGLIVAALLDRLLKSTIDAERDAETQRILDA